MRGKVVLIDSKTAIDFLLPRHYSGRVPSISVAYGWYIDGELKAVCTFGKPASPSLCKGICGEEYAKNVYELNRLCRVEDCEEPISAFVGACLRRLRGKHWIVVSYSDTAMNHNGYIYQACNFIYTGRTKERTDIWNGNGHSRHYTESDKDNKLRVVRSAKNRYVYFASFNKQEKKRWKQALKYDVVPYPKEPNKNYTLGEYLKPTVIDSNTGEIVNR